MKLFFVLLICTKSLLCIGQEENDYRRFEFLIRAKPLGFVIIEDIWVRSFSIGTEIRYNKRFSLVADLVHFRWKYEKEVYLTPGNYEDYDEFALFDARNYVALEFRYYPQISKLSDFYQPYINLYSKIGGRFIHVQEGYPLDKNEVYRMNSDFYDIGASLGMQIGEKLGFDFNIGAMHRWETQAEDIYQEDGTTVYTKDVNANRFSPNIRVNFFYNFSVN